MFFIASCAGIKIENHQKNRKIVKSSDITYDYYIPYVKYSSTPIDLDSKCTKDWRSIYVSNNFVTAVIPLFTLGLIRPQYVKYECYKDRVN